MVPVVTPKPIEKRVGMPKAEVRPKAFIIGFPEKFVLTPPFPRAANESESQEGKGEV